MSDDGRMIPVRRESADEGGFTLVELLIVVVVLGILAAVTVLGLSNISGQSLTAACHADVKSVATAQEAFRAQTGEYADSMATLVGAPAPGPYLRSLPGNTTKYTITTGNAATAPANPGRVMVSNLTTKAAAVDGESFGPGPDPCANL